MPAPSELDYHVVDVFTDRRYAGNPLAVVLGADALDTAALQAIAREFNLSETAFPMAATQHDADYRVRIFTPQEELPFAGHPSVGTAWLLRRLGRVAGPDVVQECGAGLLPLRLDGDEVTLTGGTPVLGDPLPPERVTGAVGLTPGDAAGDPVRWAGTGIEFAYLHVRPDAVARAEPDLAALAALGRAGVSVFSWAGGAVHARVFAVGAGVPEDPATGSAALGLGVWLAASGLVPPDGTAAYVVTQGVEIGRPSTLSCTVDVRAGVATRTTVRGGVVPVASGRITAP